MGDPAKHHVRHLVNLRLHRRVQARVVIPVNRRPPGGHPVNEPLAAGEVQLAAVGGGHRIDGKGAGGGGVRVPDMLLVEGEIVLGHNRLVNHFEKF